MRHDPVFMDATGILWIGLVPLAARVVAGNPEPVAAVVLPIPNGRSLVGALPKPRKRKPYAGHD